MCLQGPVCVVEAGKTLTRHPESLSLKVADGE